MYIPAQPTPIQPRSLSQTSQTILLIVLLPIFCGLLTASLLSCYYYHKFRKQYRRTVALDGEMELWGIRPTNRRNKKKAVKGKVQDKEEKKSKFREEFGGEDGHATVGDGVVSEDMGAVLEGVRGSPRRVRRRTM